MVVTFCGNRTVVDRKTVAENLSVVVKNLIEKGATKFLLGGYGDFDLLAAIAVKELKKEYPHIESVIILPYITKKYNEALYDFSVYPELERVPKKLAIIKRNEYMVDYADVVVTYIKYTGGGSFKTFQYAEKKQKQIVALV